MMMVIFIYFIIYSNHYEFHIITLAETNISPENRAVEKEIPIGNHHF